MNSNTEGVVISYQIMKATHYLETIRQVCEATGEQSYAATIESEAQADRIYNRILQLLWQIESGLDDEICREGVAELKDAAVPLPLITWMISEHLQEREATLLKFLNIYRNL